MGRFYENFERVCRAKGTSPSAAVVAIGRSKNAAANWKANGTIPKEDELEELAKHLGCEVSDFFVPEPKTQRGKDYMTYYMMMLDSENKGIEDLMKAVASVKEEHNKQIADLQDAIHERQERKAEALVELQKVEGSSTRPDLVLEVKSKPKKSKSKPLFDIPEEKPEPMKNPALDAYEADFVFIYKHVNARERMQLMNLVYNFADEHGVPL